MTSLEKTGKTVEEALDLALSELGVDLDSIEYQVLEEPSKGFFGFLGGKPARIRVTVKEKPVEPLPPVDVSPAVRAQEFLQNIFASMKLDVTVETIVEPEHTTLNMHGDDLGILIGKHGQTLDALQYLTNLAANRDATDKARIVLDVEDYRKRRTETLSRLALRLADKVKRRGERVALEPMSPHERKVIHMALQNDKRIMTYSEGDEPFRKVVIALKR